ncbi:Thiamine biosynthesis lipoprotein ApbE precursor [Caulifigura coniformis]|uniref:FAD:protein FMN transferase n=1 Tax=Caulifigura coniformis TaxID=2527983 RepID=A0A517SD25_9PLAN|nr:FAD:protein FMN transferase [Caulifigura coniformis]QDT54029.1 Thiamine biosynthesis lipoprotein ApbE precursor [Caulifigura coniformis]
MSAGPPDHSPLLPVLKDPRAPFKPLPLVVRWLVRVTRALILAAAAFLIAQSNHRRDQPSDIPFEETLRLFPTAARLGPHVPILNGWKVLDSAGVELGVVLTTSPQSDHLVGYSGPSNLLVGLDPNGGITGVSLLWSRDTAEHVEQVRNASTYWTQFRGWNPASGQRPAIEAVSGSTLTSLAMAESLEARLAGHATSLRFPDSITLAEAQEVFPTATNLKSDAGRAGWVEVRGPEDATLGYLLRTSPAAETVRGYSGPTEALVAVDSSRKRVTAVRLRSSYDTPEYVDRVRDDEGFLDGLAGKSIDDWTRIDFNTSGIEGVSGATQTSFGLAEGVRRRLQSEVEQATPKAIGATWKLRDLGLLGIVTGGLAITFVPMLGGRRVREIWQLVLVAAFGLWLGDMLSMSLLAGWSRNGASWSTAPGLVALVAVALVVPWSAKRQVYCHSLCPHGAVQEWLGRNRRLHIRLPRLLNRALGLLPWLLLIAAFVLALVRPQFNLTWLEPFDAWVLGPAAAVSMLVGLAGLVAALFVPQAYCRFGCPTGALLKFVRSHGTADRWSVRDLLAMATVGIAAAWMWWPVEAGSDGGAVPRVAGPSTLTGRAFGTSWTIKIRDPLGGTATLQDQVTAELERIEATLSHWRPGSETSQFNSSETTLEIECSKELASLVSQGLELSEATSGAFDITVGPLVDAWGNGPSGPKAEPPSNETIRTLLESIGWQKLAVEEMVPSLQKRDPRVQIDLGSLLQGHAVDRVYDLLRTAGLKEFLIEIGGELRSSGAWEVGLDPDAGAWATPRLTLRDQALSTSGVYPRGGSGANKHLLSTLTGRPAEPRWRAVAVIAPTCREADGWDTALLMAADAQAVARLRELGAQLIPSGGGGAIQTGAWPEQK